MYDYLCNLMVVNVKLKISQSELEVMNVLWREFPLGSAEVVKRLETKKDWSSRTIKTLLSRLVDKGALTTEPEGRRFLYSRRGRSV